MSIMKPPPDADLLDQSKAYHLVPSKDNWSQGVVCGELVAVGFSYYEYFTCLKLCCLECGRFVDIGDYDMLYIGKESELGEDW